MTKLERIKKDQDFKKELLNFYNRGKELLSLFTFKEIVKNKLDHVGKLNAK